MTLATFAQLAAGPCPPVGDLLLALTGAVAPGEDAYAASERLDEDARLLFGLTDLPPERCAVRLAQILTRDLGYAVERQGSAALLLPSVLHRRAGHPALLAAVAHEMARRAGLVSDVLWSTGGWHVGLGEEEQVVVALEGRPGPAAPPMMKRCCGHEVARIVLDGLASAFAAEGEQEAARRAAGLRTLLPGGDEVAG